MGNGIRRKDQKHTVRDRADLMWRDANINIFGFEDINQRALDDRYGKTGAPLSKRRNGEGPAGRDAPPGLFGWNDIVMIKNPMLDTVVKLSFITAAATVGYRLIKKR
jgi:hypothetical protein